MGSKQAIYSNKIGKKVVITVIQDKCGLFGNKWVRRVIATSNYHNSSYIYDAAATAGRDNYATRA